MKFRLFKSKRKYETKEEVSKHIADCFYKDVILELNKIIKKNGGKKFDGN